MRGLIQDVDARPTHYTDAHKRTLLALRQGKPTTAAERTELLLQYTRRSEAQQLERTVRRRQTESPYDGAGDIPTFEEQDKFKGVIPWGA